MRDERDSAPDPDNGRIPDLSLFPAELKARPQYVCWRYELRDGKPTKIPYDPKEKGRVKARASDPKTWGTLEQALAFLTAHPDMAGIGYEFSADDPYCGIDLDHVFDPATGEVLPWAKDTIERLDSYTEITPSGKGFHVIVRAKLPGPGHNDQKAGREMYDHGRYFTVTGRHWPGTPLEVKPRQDAITAIYQEWWPVKDKAPPNGNGEDKATRQAAPALSLSDQELIDKASHAKDGAKFQSLWRGNISDYGSTSEADLALCSLLAFWTNGHVASIDRLFRQSGLARPKWNERRGGRTYGEMTVAKALEGCREGYTGKRQSPPSGQAGPRDAADQPAPEPPERELPPDESNGPEPGYAQQQSGARGQRSEQEITFGGSDSASPGRNKTFEWPLPHPLPTGLPPVEPFEPGLLPAVFLAWIVDIAERTQCPIDFPAVAAIVTLAAVVGRQVGIRPKRRDDWTVVPNLWGGAIGRPGFMKTPALEEPTRPLRRLEIDAKVVYEDAVKDWETEQIVAREQEKVSGQKIRDALKKGGDAYGIARGFVESEKPEPIRRRFIVNDSTVEKLGELLNQNPNGLLLFRDELTGFLRSLEKDGHEGARAFYLEAWNGNGRFTYDRIGRGTIDIESCCLSILGGIQPGPLMDYMKSTPDDGLMQRFQLLVWPDSSQEWKDVDQWPNTSAKNAAYNVFTRLLTLSPQVVGATCEDSAIPYFRFAPDAQELFSEWRSELEHKLRGGELPPAMESHLAKYRSLVPSLALLFHLADVGRGPVGLESLERACAWAEYLESHAWRVYAPAIAPDHIGAKALAMHILKGELGDRFTLRDVYRRCWSSLNDQDRAYKAVCVLIEFDWLRSEQEITGGRPKSWYTINPRIGEVADE